MSGARRVQWVESPLGVPSVQVVRIGGMVRKRKGREDQVRMAKVRVSGGMHEGQLEILMQFWTRNNPHQDTLEIGGVLATVAQWREVLLPLLGLEVPPTGSLI